jgi:hypothetical protein
MFGLHIIVRGDPINGLSFIGPFKTGDDAMNWADAHIDDTDWWIAPLEAQKSSEAAS